MSSIPVQQVIERINGLNSTADDCWVNDKIDSAINMHERAAGLLVILVGADYLNDRERTLIAEYNQHWLDADERIEKSKQATRINVSRILDHIGRHLDDAAVRLDEGQYEAADESHTVAAALFDLLGGQLNEAELEHWKELDAQYRELDKRLIAHQEQQDELADTERILEDEALVQQYLRVRFQQNNMAGVSLQWSDDNKMWFIQPKEIMAGANLDVVEQFLTSELARYAQEGQHA